jgi:hypothetical protein
LRDAILGGSPGHPECPGGRNRYARL